MKKVKYSAPEKPNSPRIQEVGAFEAKTHLSSLLDKVAAGESFRITKRGKAIAEIRPISEEKAAPMKAGFWKQPVWMAEDFDAPLADFQEYL